MNEEKISDDSAIKPSFDGRQHFYKTLNKYQESLGSARFVNDYIGMEQSLRGFLTMVSPYIKKPDEVKTKLDLIKKFLKPKFINKFSDHIEMLLDEASFLLFDRSKYMMLPFKEEDNGEFDLEKFFKESDL